MQATPSMTTPGAKREVPEHFNDVAGNYDLLTGMNPGYTRHLRMSADRMGLPANARVLDLCCGTGLSTEALAEAYPDATIIGLDASSGMLERARKKPFAKRISFVLGDAMDPSAAGISGPFDGILMAYGIRNVPDPDLCLQRLFALLKPGGVVCFHEYSVADSLRAKALWNAVSFGVIIPGGLITNPRSQIYRYLRKSVLDFDGVRGFEERLRRAGFDRVRTMDMDGWQKRIVHSFLAKRPA